LKFKYTKVYPYHRQPLCPICGTPISSEDRTDFNLITDPPTIIYNCSGCKNEVSLSEKDAPGITFKTEEMEEDITEIRE